MEHESYVLRTVSNSHLENCSELGPAMLLGISRRRLLAAVCLYKRVLPGPRAVLQLAVLMQYGAVLREYMLQGGAGAVLLQMLAVRCDV